ncbi:hypothetical protein BH11PSE12_BH11PSE12_27060 [soil metagenome]
MNILKRILIGSIALFPSYRGFLFISLFNHGEITMPVGKKPSTPIHSQPER